MWNNKYKNKIKFQSVLENINFCGELNINFIFYFNEFRWLSSLAMRGDRKPSCVFLCVSVYQSLLYSSIERVKGYISVFCSPFRWVSLLCFVPHACNAFRRWGPRNQDFSVILVYIGCLRPTLATWDTVSMTTPTVVFLCISMLRKLFYQRCIMNFLV